MWNSTSKYISFFRFIALNHEFEYKSVVGEGKELDIGKILQQNVTKRSDSLLLFEAFNKENLNLKTLPDVSNIILKFNSKFIFRFLLKKKENK